MIKIYKVECTVCVEEEDGALRMYTANAPTVELVVEKLGVIERKINKENEL